MKIVASFIIIGIFIIIFSAIGGNIKDSNERKQAYDEYRKSTGKAMMDEAKWKSDMEEKLNK
jgi:hypothetical protein